VGGCCLLFIKTANNVKNGTSGVKTKDVTKKLQQTTTTPFENKKKWKAKRRLLETFQILGLCF
jgi:hypothetical protein